MCFLVASIILNQYTKTFSAYSVLLLSKVDSSIYNTHDKEKTVIVNRFPDFAM